MKGHFALSLISSDLDISIAKASRIKKLAASYEFIKVTPNILTFNSSHEARNYEMDHPGRVKIDKKTKKFYAFGCDFIEVTISSI